jgi:hypothetical protein
VYEAKVLADSISPAGHRLTTLQVRYPHAVHKDIMTHRALSRNFLSFRAYPPEKLEAMLADEHCYMPEVFTERLTGMSGGSPLPQAEQDLAQEIWLAAKDKAVAASRHLTTLGVAKEQANIPIQDYCWITGIVSATDWDNFFALRLDTHEDGRPKARPEVYRIASMMKDALVESVPRTVDIGGWALPLSTSDEQKTVPTTTLLKAVTGRCARISYLTHDGKRDMSADIGLHDFLCKDFHMSPFEHPATPAVGDEETGNYTGWVQYRKLIPGEANYGTAKEMDLHDRS